MAAFREARDPINTQRLDHHQRQHTRGDEPPGLGHHLQIQRHADAEEKQPQQQAAKRLYFGRQLVAECGFRQQDTSNESTHRH
ncbi:hypothetical protein D3C87_1507190 [compost metagenome]